ncbi:MAG: hypothetical protein HYR94_14740 [Chloroflexi bacterium]|nr:hypothetical protein [Chloroflexota bacterium]
MLIGFWFEKSYPDEAKVATPRNLIQVLQFWKYAGPDKIPPKLAALKAFLTTRVGDTLFFAGMMILWSAAGTLTFREIFAPEMLERLTEITLWGIPVATLSALLIFAGAVGKSAQFPLHVWLPDAMEGPTPVSALIHAATMVSAGVYLVARMLPLFATMEHSPALQWVGIIGAITAVMGATIGVAQYDVKRVLAYSTISQLGYMMMALGLGGFVAGIFHLLTHAFFKALLFLGSGSIIHAMEHEIHAAHHEHEEHEGHEAHEEHREAHHAHPDPQDMRNMGALYGKMKASFWAYLMGTLALVGIFPFAGFWSKDEILAEAFLRRSESLAFWVYVAGTVGAIFTALVTRLCRGSPPHRRGGCAGPGFRGDAAFGQCRDHFHTAGPGFLCLWLVALHPPPNCRGVGPHPDHPGHRPTPLHYFVQQVLLRRNLSRPADLSHRCVGYAVRQI